MLVKEVRIQAEVCSSSVICRTDKGTSLICIADRSTVRHAVLYVSVYAYALIMADCSSENDWHTVCDTTVDSSGTIF